MILGFGAIAGLANAGWYLAEGDYVNAALSGLSALAEVAGAMAVAAKSTKFAATVGKGLGAAESAEDVISAAGKASRYSDEVK